MSEVFSENIFFDKLILANKKRSREDFFRPVLSRGTKSTKKIKEKYDKLSLRKSLTCPTIDRLIVSQKKLRRGIFVNVDNFIGTLAKENENGLRKFMPQQVFYPVTWTCQDNTRKLTEHGCCKSQIIVYTAISWKEIPSDRYGFRSLGSSNK